MENLNFEIKSKKKNCSIHFGDFHNVTELLMSSDISEIVLLSDDNLYRLYRDKIDEMVEKLGAYKIIIKPGERSKELGVVMEIFSKLNKVDLNRQSMIVAFGGGVVGDVAGFVASTFLRGIKLLQIPTTVLSQVDSSVGGKTAVNFQGTKNRIGTFYQPENVFVDSSFLNTLDDREFRNGCAEIIKYGCIMDEELFHDLNKNLLEVFRDDTNRFDRIIKRCIEIKSEVVIDDEEDTGKRQILNFGHTLGHVFEGMDEYSLFKHGEGVALGMYLVSLWGEEKGYTQKGTTESLKKVLKLNGFGLKVPDISEKKFLEEIKKDKKGKTDGVNFILLRKIGECFVKKIEVDEIEEMIRFICTREEI